MKSFIHHFSSSLCYCIVENRFIWYSNGSINFAWIVCNSFCCKWSERIACFFHERRDDGRRSPPAERKQWGVCVTLRMAVIAVLINHFLCSFWNWGGIDPKAGWNERVYQLKTLVWAREVASFERVLDRCVQAIRNASYCLWDYCCGKAYRVPFLHLALLVQVKHQARCRFLCSLCVVHKQICRKWKLYSLSWLNFY